MASCRLQNPEVQPFLNPLSIKKIPGLGDATFMKLSEMGVRKIHTLTQVPQDMMFKILGNNGLSLWQKANGIDHSPVVPYREQKSIGKQTTFDSDSMDIATIKVIFTDMITKLAFELRQKQKLTACVTVTIRYANFETITQQAKIPYTSLDSVLIIKAKEYVDKVYQKRMLLRLVGVKLSHLVSGYEQIALYGTSEKMYNLYQSMDKMRSRYGVDTIKLATVLPNKGGTKKLYRQQ
jgi:DNA polymerase-4